MTTQRLQVWANTLNTDAITEDYQRYDLTDEEFRDGWLRLMPVDAQQLNQLFYTLTLASNPHYNVPTLYPTSLSLIEGTLEFNGQAITEEDNPNAYSIYGANLPDLRADAPSGFTYIMRNS